MKRLSLLLLIFIFGTSFCTPLLHSSTGAASNFSPHRSRDFPLEGYIVVLKRGRSLPQHLLAASHHRTGIPNVRHVWEKGALRGYAGKFDKSALAHLRANPDVAYVEKDVRFSINDLQSQAPYNLAITSQAARLGGRKQTEYYYTTNFTNNAVKVYIVDTGLYSANNQFEGRAYLAQNFIEDEPNEDDNGHGTHVAGIVGARDYGVYKSALLAGVKVLRANGTGMLSDVLAGINWVVTDSTGSPAVINLSLGGGYSQALNDAVQGAVQAGVTVVTAAGNAGVDACGTSPSSAPDVISVAAISRAYRRPSFSNYGSCVDIFAPGVDVISTWNTGPDATATATGTSMSSPHIAGLAAYLIAINGSSNPGDVYNRIMELSEANLVRGIRGSPNRIGNNGYFVQQTSSSEN